MGKGGRSLRCHLMRILPGGHAAGITGQLFSASEWRPRPSRGANHASLVTMYGSKKTSMLNLPSFPVLVMRSLDTHRSLFGNALSTLPEGLFEGLTAMESL